MLLSYHLMQEASEEQRSFKNNFKIDYPIQQHVKIIIRIDLAMIIK